MNYGLNNMLGNANNTNKTQNSAKRNKNLEKLSNRIGAFLDIPGMLEGIKSGKTGWDRIKSMAGLISSGYQLYSGKKND